MGIFFETEVLANGWSRIQLAGDLKGDVEAPLAALAAQLAPCVILNFANVEAADIDGGHAWVRFIDRVSGERQIVFEECLPCIVDQIATVPGFKGNCRIASVYAPFACVDCCAQHNVLFELHRSMPTPPRAPRASRKCHWCGGPMLPLENLDEYLMFALALDQESA